MLLDAVSSLQCVFYCGSLSPCRADCTLSEKFCLERDLQRPSETHTLSRLASVAFFAVTLGIDQWCANGVQAVPFCELCIAKVLYQVLLSL